MYAWQEVHDRLGGTCNSDKEKCMSLCFRRNEKYRTGVPVDDNGRRRVRFNPHVEMNICLK